MGQMKTPGVYIVEKSAFPNSVVEVATAVPAFIGHTEKAVNGGKSLKNKPWRISSMAEFHNFYGGAPHPAFEILRNESPGNESVKGQLEESDKDKDVEKKDIKKQKEHSVEKVILPEPDLTVKGKEYLFQHKKGTYLLYYSMLMFFQNGGGPCYIISIGDYTEDYDADKMKAGITQLLKEQEPTMVLIPEAIRLNRQDCVGVQQASLAHCGGKMKSRISILDIWEGYKDRHDPSGDCIDNFRNALGINYLDFAAAYYPWVNTTIIQDKDLGYENIANKGLLQEILKEDLEITSGTGTDPKKIQKAEAVDNIVKEDLDDNEKLLLNKTLRMISPSFNIMLKEIKDKLNLLPPGAAMAGIYTMVDNLRGVWKAPANVSLNGVVSPAVNITHDDQEDLNVTVQGKSINAIRAFIGEGVLVWGARTLDGNSLDWRYINVRRTMIMLEESIRLATKAYVFENNNANTWVTIKSMINNFLTGIWKRGGLAGSSPGDAFSVHVGLGETMTPEDILEGILRVTVLVAITRPAEFIEITFQQQMQKS